MSLDQFTGDSPPPQKSGSDDSDSSKRGAKESYTGSPANKDRWVTKLDFSVPYVVVARDSDGNFYYSRANSVFIKDPEDWRRLEENPHKDVEVLFARTSREAWLRFCSLAKKQFDENPAELLEEDHARLMELNEEVYYPPVMKPKKDATCTICGKARSEPDVAILRTKPSRPCSSATSRPAADVCADHTVAELAKEGII